MLQVVPDWRETGTLAQLSKSLGIKITGPGAYLSDTDTVMVLPLRKDGDYSKVWDAKQPRGTKFAMYVYNCHHSYTMFSRSDSPTRMDTRGDDEQTTLNGPPF